MRSCTSPLLGPLGDGTASKQSTAQPHRRPLEAKPPPNFPAPGRLIFKCLLLGDKCPCLASTGTQEGQCEVLGRPWAPRSQPALCLHLTAASFTRCLGFRIHRMEWSGEMTPRVMLPFWIMKDTTPGLHVGGQHQASPAACPVPLQEKAATWVRGFCCRWPLLLLPIHSLLKGPASSTALKINYTCYFIASA